jgi:hypothetical protein
MRAEKDMATEKDALWILRERAQKAEAMLRTLSTSVDRFVEDETPDSTDGLLEANQKARQLIAVLFDGK